MDKETFSVDKSDQTLKKNVCTIDNDDVKTSEVLTQKDESLTARQKLRIKRKRNKSSKMSNMQDMDKVKNMVKLQDEKNIETLIVMGNAMWKKLKDTIKEDKDFVDMSDKKKITHFRDVLGYTEFMNEFPVMTRYMVCMGQYSSKAFRKFLDKIRITKHPPAEEREKGYMEDQWVRRQSDYVQYLWEAYQKGHYNNAEHKWVWKDAYKNLKGEFDDFRDKYKAIEKSTEEEKIKLSASNARDLLNRLKTGEQKLSDNDSAELLFLLKNKLYRRNFSDALKDLLSKVKYIYPVCLGLGKGPEEDTSEKPTVRMVESVDEDRMGEIPAEYRLDQQSDDLDVTPLPTINEHNENLG